MKLVKKLDSIQDISKKNYTKSSGLEETLDKLSHCLIDLTEKLNKMNSPIIDSLNILSQRVQAMCEDRQKQNCYNSKQERHPQKYKNQSEKGEQSSTIKWSNDEPIIQQRYVKVEVPLINIQGISGSSRINQILNWVGLVCKKVFSVGFNMLKSGEYEVNKIKAFCSENILRNIINFSHHVILTPGEFKVIDNCLKKQLLPYFCLKYPQTEQRQVNKKFADLLIERDTLNENKNDLISKKSGNYNSQIMQFFNFIITLPNQQIKNDKDKDSQKQGNHNQNATNLSFAQQFYKDMEGIFKLVESEQNKIKMLMFNPKKQILALKKPQNNKNIELNIQQKERSIKELQKQKQDYIEKVRSYTSYQIGRKLSQNFKTFTQYQIKSGSLKLTNSNIMRVATKWCDQLSKNFDEEEIINRQNPFMMKNGIQKFMKSSHTQYLNSLLQRQKQIINQNLQKIQKNNYYNQSETAKQKINKQFTKYSVQQALVGNFCTSMFKINENYLINYLNLLIHGINKALYDFQKFQRALKINPFIQTYIKPNHSIEQLPKMMVKEVDVILQQHKDTSQALSETPELISFKIGDLLRCKCSSKEAQIEALYKQLERINRDSPDVIRIIRVKNKLDQGNKDILINLLYRKTMIVEMQLAIKSDKSKFIVYSNQFNHYFYEMKRSQFGPIMEMCCIWASQDPRAQFYLDQVVKLRLQKSQNCSRPSDCCLKFENNTNIILPFKCSFCHRFFYDCSVNQKHSQCKICLNLTCFICKFESVPAKLKKQLLPYIEQKNKLSIEKMNFLKQIPKQGGALINLKSKQKKVILFKTIKYKGYYYLFRFQNTNQQNQKLEVIEKFKSLKPPEQFFMSHIIFTSEQVTHYIPKINEQTIQAKYFLIKWLKQIHKAQKRSISLVNKNLNNQFLVSNSQINEKTWNSVKKINLSENNFSSIKQISQKFPNAKLATLSLNSISKITQEDISNWKNLKYLTINNNTITGNLSGIASLKDLIQLSLKKTNLSSIPQYIQQISSLKILNVSENSLTQIPPFVSALAELTSLEADNNKIASISKDICLLQNLTNLVMTKNLLSSLPEQIGKLKNLRTLLVANNTLSQLPESICMLKLLTNLDVSENKLIRVPDGFGQLIALQTLGLHSNKLVDLPESICNLKNLSQLNIYSNELKQLPEQIGRLKLLKKLYLYNNKLKYLPDSICEISSLIILKVRNNQIESLPAQIGDLQNLRIFTADFNELKQLPVSICSLEHLTNLDLSNNQIEELPANFGNFDEMIDLKIRSNRLRKLPDCFGKMKKLDVFMIDSNKLQQLPPSICQLSSLNKLIVFRNSLKQLPQSFDKLIKLKHLSINENSLKHLPNSFGNLPELQQIQLFQNKLQKLPQNFGDLLRIKYLKLFDNNIQCLPESISNLKNLMELNLDRNKLKLLPNSIGALNSLMALYLTSNNLTQIPQSLGNLQSLKICLMQDNEIHTIPESIIGLKSMTSFRCKGNKAKYFPITALYHMGNLKELTLFVLKAQLEQLAIYCSKANDFYNLTLQSTFKPDSEIVQKLASILAQFGIGFQYEQSKKIVQENQQQK